MPIIPKSCAPLKKKAIILMSQLSRQKKSTHLTQLHIQTQEKVKINLLEKQNSISLTQDAGTAPNVTAFMTWPMISKASYPLSDQQKNSLDVLHT